MNTFDLIMPYTQHLSYLGVFLYFALLGYVIWIPEEVVLLAIGYFASVNGHSPYPALAVTIAGVLVGDNLFYYLSRQGSPRLRRFERKLSSGKLRQYRQMLENHIGKTIVVSRFVAGLRFLGPYIAGTKNLPWRKFFFMNAAVAILISTIFISVGYHFQEQMVHIIRQITYWRHVFFVIFLVIVGYFVSRELMRFIDWEEEYEEKRMGTKL